jgi:hypothetical protein
MTTVSKLGSKTVPGGYRSSDPFVGIMTGGVEPAFTVKVTGPPIVVPPGFETSTV